MDRRCYHPHVTGAEAEQQLKLKEHGSFLCREETNSYILSVLNGNEVSHLKMTRVGFQFRLCDDQLFDSPFDVIQHHLINQVILSDESGRVCHLGKPHIREVLLDTRWYHGDINPERVEELLMARGSDGSFLVTSSYVFPGDYLLCVRVKEEVVHMKIRSTGKMFDLGGGKQFGCIEHLVEHYKKQPIKITDGRQVYLLQELECTEYTSRQSICIDGAAISCFQRTERYVTPVFPQLEYDVSWEPIPWVNIGDCTLATINSPDQDRSDGMIAIYDSDGQYSLNLDGCKDTIKSQFTLYKALLVCYCPPISVRCLESKAFPGYYLEWIDGRDLTIGFCVGKSGSPPATQDDDARRICWNLLPAPNPSQTSIDGSKNNSSDLVCLRTWSSTPDTSDLSSGKFLSFETKASPDNTPVLTTDQSVASSILIQMEAQ